jgi:hypothetical protein
MAIDPRNINSEDDSLILGDDATATFDNSRSNPTERASSENLGAQTSEEEDDIEEDEDLDEDIEDDDEDDDEDVDEEDAEEEEDDNLMTNPRTPGTYRML